MGSSGVYRILLLVGPCGRTIARTVGGSTCDYSEVEDACKNLGEFKPVALIEVPSIPEYPTYQVVLR